jgi:Ca-activated chloride channel family protein
VGIHHFGFGSPQYLLALLVVPLFLVFLAIVRRRRVRYTVTFSNVAVVARVVARRRRRPPELVAWVLLALALAVAALALARPHVQTSAANRTATIVLLVDVSQSMQAQDVKPNRLTAVVTAMHEFLNVVPPEDKVGLVTFSDKVDVLSPPTTDHAAVSNDLDVLAPQGGTALGNGVDAAVKLIVSSLAADGIHHEPGQYLPAAIVLESDGAQTRGVVSPFRAAQLAKATGVRIYGVALGRRNAFLAQGSGYFELKIPVPPDPGTVGILVRTSGGVAYAARNATRLENVYRQLGLTIGTRPQRTDITSWFLFGAAILLVLAVLASRLRGSPLP